MRHLYLFLPVALGACYAVPSSHPAQRLEGMPEERLPAAEGWQAYSLLPLETELTRVEALELLDTYGSSEVMALDRRGRCWVLANKGGRWSGWETVHDREPLVALGQGQVDPRRDGPEAFVGGDGGNLYLVGVHPQGAVDARLIAHFPGARILSILAADLDPFAANHELLVFTHPGGAWRVHATGDHGAYVAEAVAGLDPGVRDAVALPFEVGRLPAFATASHAGRVSIVSLTPDGPELEILAEEDTGVARLGLAPEASWPRGGPVLYSCLDDGRVLRHARDASGSWRSETIHAAGRGPRGLAAGRFDPDPTVETLVILGEQGSVELLSGRDGNWESRTLFEELEAGSWLTRCELDGRNTTDEILACGLDGSILLLAHATTPNEGP